MKKRNSNYIWKLGMFVIIGLLVFFATLYFIGSSQNLFGSTFHLKTKFKNVSGLKVDNNVLLSGINIGSIKEIEFISDSSVVVVMVIKNEVQQYIKTDALASIGSDGLMGDKVVTISPGNKSDRVVENDSYIASVEEVELQDLMSGLKKSIDNAEVITKELSEFSYKINNGEGMLSKILTDPQLAKSVEKSVTNLEEGSDQFVLFTKKMNDKNGTFSKLMTDPYYTNSIKKSLSGLEKSTADINTFTATLNNGNGIVSKLLTDTKLAKSLDSTMTNLQTGTKKLNELEEAAKHNFLLRGFFRKQEKEKKKIEDAKSNK
ncbi:phospholipid/cholesterol/gamma-HCH transport system substrate-binding protein [Flavobacterium sp. 28A]|uniref:MlaD family protein n=1 Tax=Flavobacterium sp. 28A TaxID=2735895 RepID=UPI001570571B|nr:MlaD family protein [Flavobacterium sp. 28A]NRT16338.1 phospholipid/cholesterol/gamma-HCH transport system substrate-binding protein [Flavobacterium sp. 28A]